MLSIIVTFRGMIQITLRKFSLKFSYMHEVWSKQVASEKRIQVKV